MDTDLSHNIDNFTGLEVVVKAKAWLKQLESTATLHRWTEDVAFERARAHLEQAARTWFWVVSIQLVIGRPFIQNLKEHFLRRSPWQKSGSQWNNEVSISVRIPVNISLIKSDFAKTLDFKCLKLKIKWRLAFGPEKRVWISCHKSFPRWKICFNESSIWNPWK